ncbi:MAG TPA: GNAT family N-acetyltransferase [Limnochordia bacterium]|nr:GNAT family N-acetyltransferase [Limnochordia bacterium]
MVEAIATASLRDGSTLKIVRVCGPEPGWLPHIAPFLGHKPEVYRWQIIEGLQRSWPGLQTDFYLGLLDGQLVANITLITNLGLGVLGHVYTLPQHRGKGIASVLMGAQMRHFAENGGRALVLGTGYGSTAYRIYERHGFRSIVPESGSMHWTAAPDTYAKLFATELHEVRPVAWSDWGGLCALFGMPEGDFLRSSIYPAVRPTVVEGNFISLMRRIEKGELRAWSAVDREGVVLGVALMSRHTPWRSRASVQLDLYAHPAHLAVLAPLDAAVEAATAERGGRRLMYASGDAAARIAALQELGYTVDGRVAGELAGDGERHDLVILHKG